MIKVEVLSKENTADFLSLLEVFSQVFDVQRKVFPEREYLQSLLEKDSFEVIVAKDGGNVIGGLTIYVLDPYYSTRPLAYIYDLAVLENYQRKGIGRSLIDHTLEFCRKKGFEAVFVQAEKVDQHAVDFYRKTNPADEEDVVYFNYRLQDK